MTRYGILAYSYAEPISLFARAGFSFQPGATAISIRGDVVSAGPFHAGHPAAVGFFVIEAPDLDVVLAIVRGNLYGGVEVRPLFEWAG